MITSRSPVFHQVAVWIVEVHSTLDKPSVKIVGVIVTLSQRLGQFIGVVENCLAYAILNQRSSAGVLKVGR
jgi:hypothetical protein